MAVKVEAKGGNGGNKWDDGFDYEGITKIHVRGGIEGLQFVKFDYVKAGKTTAGPIHGVSGRGLTQTFEINHSEKEYLLSVEGYYDKSTGVIQSLQFKTNKKTSDLMGYNEGTKFSLSATRSRIIGFHGFSDKNVNSLGAYFIRIPSTKSGMQGGQTTGKSYDHGGDYDGIKKVYVTFDGTAIRHIRVDYDKAGQVESHEHGEKIGTLHEFAVNYPFEYITSVQGSYAVTQPYGCIVLRSLTFKTSNGRTSEVGTVVGTKFVLESQGNAIVGLHGRVGSCVDSIGAYYAPFSVSSPEKTEMQGGQTTGIGYDHGGDYNGIKKVYVTFDGTAIRHIRVDYDKVGQVESHEHGDKIGTLHEFAVNYPYEYITSVEGSYAVTQPYGCIVLRSLTFKTSNGRTSAIGTVVGTKFVLESHGNAIVGFHGRVGSCVDSIGAYYAPFSPFPPLPPPVKSGMQGGQTTGKGYDHGGEYNGIKKVYVTFDGTAIRHIRVDYNKAGQVESYEHGEKIGTLHEFAINFPYEYITSVEGSYAVTQPYGCIVLRSLTFKTSKGRTSAIGTVVGTKFVLESQGKAIVGFHGRVGSCVDSIGAYYAPFSPSPPPSEKLEGQGGDGGASWDDGAFQNVKKIYVGQGQVGIVSVKFEYENDASEVVVGEEHGKQTLLGYEEFQLDYPSEYITSVEACHDKVIGAETGVVTMLKFKTNKRTSPPFGLETAFNFVFQKEGHKITGFHGKSGDVLHKIGVHVVPITQ